MSTALLAYALVGRAAHYEWLMFAAWAVLLAPPIALVLWRSKDSENAVSGSWSPRAYVAACVVAFLVVSALVTFHFRTTTLNPDETAYRFQGRVFASGQLMAEAPWSPGEEAAGLAPSEGIHTPLPLRYNHHIYQPQGWFVKYPLLFPLALAGGQLLQLEWLVNPLLGTMILALMALLAANVFDASTAGAAVIAAVLSPYFLGNSIGWMSHPLCGVLVAAAFFFGFRALDARRLSPVIPMLILLALAFHTRPFTAFIATIILSGTLLWSFRDQRRLCVSLFALLVGAGACIVGSVLFYNWIFSGSPLLSPYALYKNSSSLTEIDLSIQTIVRNAIAGTRFGLQGTLFSVVPGLFALALFGAWRFRKHSIKVWALGALFPLLVVGYSFNPISSGSQIGERFWFEGFFAVAILGGAAAVDVARWTTAGASTIRVIVAALAVAQAPVGYRLIQGLEDRFHGYAAVTAEAQSLKDCGCAVFLDFKEPYLGEHLNLNSARWRESDVFYLIDPGPDLREQWSRRFGFDRWKVISYDPRQDVVNVM